MTNTPLIHTATITSRICHDLANPMGAISNGMELLELSGLPDGPELALIQNSIAHAKAKITFFRLAYGAVGDGDIAKSEITEMLAVLYGEDRIRVAFEAPNTFPKRLAKLAILLIKCCEAALKQGGQIKVDLTETRLEITATGPAIVQGEVWQHLETPSLESVSSSDSHFALAGYLIQDHPHPLQVTSEDTALTLSLPL